MPEVTSRFCGGNGKHPRVELELSAAYALALLQDMKTVYPTTHAVLIAALRDAFAYGGTLQAEEARTDEKERT